MDLYIWCISASLLLVSAGAGRYDQAPQRFYDVSDTATSEQNEREVVVYLTPDQVNTLEAGGAVVRSEDDFESNAESGTGPATFPQVYEDQQDEENEADQDEETQQEQGELQSPDIDLEEILRILNEQQLDEEAAEEAVEEQARNEPQVEEENTEKPRSFSPRFNYQQQQQEGRYLAPAAAKKQQRLQSYSYIRYQSDEQPQSVKEQLLQQQPDSTETEENSEEYQNKGPENSLKKKYKLIPYDVEENSEEPQQNAEAEEGTESQITLDANKLAAAITQRRNTLLQNEIQIQTILRQLKSAPSKFNDQKYAIEIEKLRANLDKQNTLSKAEAIAKAEPALIKQQIEKKRRFNKTTKQGKSPGENANAESQAKPQSLKSKQNSAERPRPIPVPVIKAEKSEVGRPIPVPVETNKRLSIKNIYVRTDKPYTVERKVPENKRQAQTEIPSRKPERITILRHIWEP